MEENKQELVTEENIGLTARGANLIFVSIMESLASKLSSAGDSPDDILEKMNIVNDTVSALSGLKNMILDPSVVSPAMKIVEQALLEKDNSEKEGK